MTQQQNNKNNVSGPYTREEWDTMLNLKEDIRFVQKRKVPSVDYSISLDHTKGLLKGYLRKRAA